MKMVVTYSHNNNINLYSAGPTTHDTPYYIVYLSYYIGNNLS